MKIFGLKSMMCWAYLTNTLIKSLSATTDKPPLIAVAGVAPEFFDH
jgi:hypothetical protein